MKHTCDKIYKQNISQNINFSLEDRIHKRKEVWARCISF